MPKKRRKKPIKNYELKITNDDKASGRGVGIKSGKAAEKVLIVRENEDSQGAISARQGVTDEFQFNNEQAERKNKLIMWAGVSCLMVIFFAVWIFTLKYEFKVSLNKSAGNGFNWSQTKVELAKAMTQVKQGLAEIKKIQAGSSLPAQTGLSAGQAGQNASSSEPVLTAEQIDLLKGKLLDEAAAGIATSTIKN